MCIVAGLPRLKYFDLMCGNVRLMLKYEFCFIRFTFYWLIATPSEIRHNPWCGNNLQWARIKGEFSCQEGETIPLSMSKKRKRKKKTNIWPLILRNILTELTFSLSHCRLKKTFLFVWKFFCWFWHCFSPQAQY